MWVSFLLAFVWARVWTWLVGYRGIDIVSHEQIQIGSRVVIFGYHPHHIAFGVLLLAVAGWMGIHYAGKVVTRFAAVFYGVGIGFIVDEVSFIVGGIGNYQRSDLPEVLVLAVIVGALMMSSIYFPQFWASIEGRVARFYARHARHRRSVGPRPPVPEPDGPSRQLPVPVPEAQDASRKP